MPRSSGPSTAEPGVVGRDSELARLERLLAGAGAGSAATAVIRGETGCGKTHLLDAVAERARADGWRCLRIQGVESEAVLAGAGLLSVLSPVRGGLDAVPEPQAQALSAALGWAPATGSGDRFLVGAGTLSLLAAESSRTPLLIAVDDVQWVDVESAEALTFAARRLGHDRVAVVMTHRGGTPLPVPLDGFEVITVEGLAAGPAQALLGPGFSTDVVATLVAQTGGNPLALLECQRLLGRAQRAGAAPLPEVLPVPERLRHVYADELGDLPPGAWRAAVLCAASSDQAAAPVLAALAAEGLDPGTCLAGLGDLLLAQDGVLRFRHPMLRSATWGAPRRPSGSARTARSPPSSPTGPPARGTARRPHRVRTWRWPWSWRRSPTWTAPAAGSRPPRGPWNAPPGSLPTPLSGATGSPPRRTKRTSPVTPTAHDGWRPRCSAPTWGPTPGPGSWSRWGCSSGTTAPLRAPVSSWSRRPTWPPDGCWSARCASSSTPATSSTTPTA